MCRFDYKKASSYEIDQVTIELVVGQLARHVLFENVEKSSLRSLANAIYEFLMFAIDVAIPPEATDEDVVGFFQQMGVPLSDKDKDQVPVRFMLVSSQFPAGGNKTLQSNKILQNAAHKIVDHALDLLFTDWKKYRNVLSQTVVRNPECWSSTNKEDVTFDQVSIVQLINNLTSLTKAIRTISLHQIVMDDLLANLINSYIAYLQFLELVVFEGEES